MQERLILAGRVRKAFEVLNEETMILDDEKSQCFRGFVHNIINHPFERLNCGCAIQASPRGRGVIGTRFIRCEIDHDIASALIDSAAARTR
jgi:hypothetical protein